MAGLTLKGGSLTLGSVQEYDFGELTLTSGSETDLNIAVGIDALSTITIDKFNGEATGKLTLVVTDEILEFLKETAAEKKFQVFKGAGDDSDLIGISKDLKNQKLSDRENLYLKADGTLVYESLEGRALIWQGNGKMDGENIWEGANGDEEDWAIRGGDNEWHVTAFQKDDDVTFDETGVAEHATVKVSDGVTAGDMAVTAAGYTFTGDSTLTVNNLLLTAEDVEENGVVTKTTTFEVDTVVTQGLSSQGNMTLRGAEMEVQGNLSYTGTVTLQDGKMTAHGWLKRVAVGAGENTLTGGEGGLETTLRGTGALEAAGQLTLRGILDGMLTVADGATVTGHRSKELTKDETAFTVFGVNGAGTGDDPTTLSGDIMIKGTGGSYAGTVNELTIELGEGATQTFRGTTDLTKATVGEGATLTLGASNTVDAADVTGTLQMAGGSLSDLTGAGTLDITSGEVTLGDDGEIGNLDGTGKLTGSTLTLKYADEDKDGRFSGELNSNLNFTGTSKFMFTVDNFTGGTLTMTSGNLTLTGKGGSSAFGGADGQTLALDGGSLTLDGTTVTVDTSEGVTLTKGELVLNGSGSNTVNGDVEMKSGLTLNFASSDANEVDGVVTLVDGSTLQWKESTDGLTVEGLKGEAGTLKGEKLTINGKGGEYSSELGSVKNVTMSGDGNQKFTNGTVILDNATVTADGTLTLGGEGSTVSVETATVTSGTLTLAGTNGNTITGALSGAGTLDVDAATSVEKTGQIGTLDVDTEATLTLGKHDGDPDAAELTVTELMGGGTISNDAGVTGSKLVLNDSDNSGTFSGRGLHVGRRVQWQQADGGERYVDPQCGGYSDEHGGDRERWYADAECGDECGSDECGRYADAWCECYAGEPEWW